MLDLIAYTVAKTICVLALHSVLDHGGTKVYFVLQMIKVTWAIDSINHSSVPPGVNPFVNR